MNNNTKTNYFTITMMILCTLSIILSNFIFAKRIVLDIDKQLLENEYKKIGGKENYNLLKELQKQEILGYINKLKEENPELIEDIKQKIKLENRKDKYKILPNDVIEELKKDTYVKGSSGALVTIIEFSDLECPYCIESHKKNIKTQILEKYPEETNYIFKNFPLPKNKNSNAEANAALCVKSISGGDKYLEFIDKIYNTTEGGGEGFDLNNIVSTAEEIGVDKNDFEKCYEEQKQKDNLEIEFKQGLKLGINSVPSTLLVNNTTGEYSLISEMVDFEDIDEIVGEFVQK